MERRSFIGLLGTGVGAGVAGCSALGSESDTVEESREIAPSSSELSASEFRTVAAESHDTYGTAGVWGRAESEPDHELDFQGAWRTTLSHGDGVQSDHLVAMYRLPPRPDGVESSQVWLWSGLDPSDGATIRRLETGLVLPDGGPQLGIYAPAQEYRAADVTSYQIASGRLDVSTLQATIPISAGRVSVGEQTQIGKAGTYAPFWSGESEMQQSLTATTDIQWANRAETTVTWMIAVETAP